MMSGRHYQPVDPARAEDRRVVARTGTEAHPGFGDRKLLDRRHRTPGAFDQREQAACRDRIVEAALLDGGADHEPPVEPRHQIFAARQPHHVAQQWRFRVHAQGQHLPLDRAHRGEMRGWNAADLARPGARRQHDEVGPIVALFSGHAASTLARDIDFPNRAVLVQHGAGATSRFGEGTTHKTVVDLVIARAQHRARQCPVANAARGVAHPRPTAIRARGPGLFENHSCGGDARRRRASARRPSCPHRGSRPRCRRRLGARARNPATASGSRASAPAASPRRARSRPRRPASPQPPSSHPAPLRRGHTR